MKAQFPVSLLLAALAALAFARRTVHVGPQADGSTVVPTHQRIRPAGDSLTLAARPVDLALAGDGSRAWVKDNRGLVVLDPRGWTLLQQLPFPSGGGSMHGIAATRDGARVFLTSAQDQLWEAERAADGSYRWAQPRVLPGPRSESGAPSPSHACGVALSADETQLLVCLSRNNTLGVLDLRSGQMREIPVGVAPFDVVLLPDRSTACVSNWGGRHPRSGEPAASSSGTPTLVDRRGVAASGTVSFVDLAAGRVIKEIAVGLHPSDVALLPDGDTLCVANANSDTISLVGISQQAVRQTLPIRPDPALPSGTAPNALAVTPDGKKLLVACGGINALAQVALGATREGLRGRVEGFIPAGWYPGAVVTDGLHAFVANVKGAGSRKRREQDPAYNSHGHQGTLTRVRLPGHSELARWTRQVREDARIPAALRAQERGASGTPAAPVPVRAGEPSVFDHVVYVIKENRTYDQVFGDLPQGNGDPKLCLYGREITPNHHALAEQFVLLDNYYCNGVLSADGHSWSTEGNVTDHLEKAFGGFTRSYTFGDDPITYSSTGFLWDQALDHGRSFRNYGECDYAEPVPAAATFTDIFRDWREKQGKIRFRQQIGIERLRRHSCRAYPGWNMKIPDGLRADVFLRELAECEKSGAFPNLTIVYLPSDHTSGTEPGAPTPRAQVADNDLALGRIVEAISRSRFWRRTAIFVIEDDPQDGFDHVDGHRSLCLVVSPYARRGAVVSEFYNQSGVVHTISRILGVPAPNQMTSLSPIMAACFTRRPDFRPYTCLPNRVPLDEMNPPISRLSGPARHWALASTKQNLDRVDAADEDTMNRILWHAAKGVHTPYPAHLAGAHGSGLSLAPER